MTFSYSSQSKSLTPPVSLPTPRPNVVPVLSVSRVYTLKSSLRASVFPV